MYFDLLNEAIIKYDFDEDNMQILNKLFGFYQNWRESWISASSDLEAMANHLKDVI